MSLIIVHLRWDDVDPEQYQQLCRALPDGAQRPAGCLLRQRRRQGSAVLATEVWIDEGRADAFLSALPDLLGPGAMGRPQRVLFAVPDWFAVGYGVRPACPPAPVQAPPVLVPAPRSATDTPTAPRSATDTPATVAAGDHR